MIFEPHLIQFHGSRLNSLHILANKKWWSWYVVWPFQFSIRFHWVLCCLLSEWELKIFPWLCYVHNYGNKNKMLRIVIPEILHLWEVRQSKSETARWWYGSTSLKMNWSSPSSERSLYALDAGTYIKLQNMSGNSDAFRM